MLIWGGGHHATEQLPFSYHGHGAILGYLKARGMGAQLQHLVLVLPGQSMAVLSNILGLLLGTVQQPYITWLVRRAGLYGAEA